MLRPLLNGEQHLIVNDPVRPHITFEQRTTNGRTIRVLDIDGGVGAVVCIALCHTVPTTEQELFEYADPRGDILVAYTVWSYTPGAGRTIINELRTHAQLENIVRLVTLSPLTEMAERFHLRNGAELLDRYDTCQNFEYSLA